MTKSLYNQLKKKGYRTVFRLNDRELACTKKTAGRVNDNTDFDVYTLNKSENLDGMVTFDEFGDIQLYSI